MKVLYFLFFFIHFLSFGQTIDFTYDQAGNQIQRKYIWDGNRQSNQEVKDYDDLVNSDLEKFFPEDVISYYPNPVKEELFLQWELIDNKNVENISIYNISGQVIKNVKISSEKRIVLNFSDFSVGSYLVILFYSNGEKKEIKIIKSY